MNLGDGRRRVSARHLRAGALILDIQLSDSGKIPRVLMLRKGTERSHIEVEVLEVTADNDLRAVAHADIEAKQGTITPRELLKLSSWSGAGSHLRVRIIPRDELQSDSTRPLVIDEIGLYASDEGLLRDARPWLTSMSDSEYYQKYVPRLIRALMLCCIVFVPLLSCRYRAPAGITYIILAAAAASLLLTYAVYSPFWTRDFKIGLLASGTLQEGAGSNLNYGLHMGASLLQGNGPVIGTTVPWHRMPGYAFFNAIAGILAGTTSDLYLIGICTVALQVLFFTASAGFCYWALAKLLGSLSALVVLSVAVILPSQVFYTQVDSIIPAIAFLNLGAISLLLANVRANGHASRWLHTLVHGSFALWFVMRPDVLPGWLAVSVILYWKTWRMLVLPVCFALAIGLPWGAFRYYKNGEFVMTTTSVGASAMGGLWEAPNKFKWEVSDGSVFEWMKLNGQQWGTKSSNDFAVREVVRFWFTYPGYMVSLVWHELNNFVYLQSWPGFNSPVLSDASRLRGSLVWGLFALIALSIAIGYQRLRTILVTWAVFFNLPIFFLIYSSGGRFYSGVSVGLLAGSLPLVLDRGFYRQLVLRPLVSMLIATLFVIVSVYGLMWDKALLGWNEFRYWTPFLDPTKSTLSILR